MIITINNKEYVINEIAPAFCIDDHVLDIALFKTTKQVVYNKKDKL